MKRNIKLMISALTIATLSVGTLAYTGVTTHAETIATTTVATTADTTVDLSAKASSYTDSELSPTYTTSNTITLKDNGSTSSSKNVVIDGNTITIKSAGTYVISGTLTDGQIVVDSKDDAKVQLVLDNAKINSNTYAPISVLNSKYTMITLKDGTVNTLTDKEDAYKLTSDEEVDSVIYSKDDLVLNGAGTLNVTALYNDAIKSNDTMYILDGTYNVKSKQDAFYGKDAIIVDGGTFNIVTFTGADSVEMVAETFGGGAPMDFSNMTDEQKAEMEARFKEMEANGFTPPTGDMGTPPTGGTNGQMMAPPTGANGQMMAPPTGANGQMMAPPTGAPTGQMPTTTGTTASTTTKQLPSNFVKSNANATTVATTTTTATTETTEEDTTGSNKGFKSKGEIIINDGTFKLDTYDDGINAGTFLEINGGEFNINSGDDAIKGEYLLTINGGNINVSNCYEGIESKTINLNGGDIDVTSFDDGINASDPDATSEVMPGNPFGSDSEIDENDPIINFNGANVTVLGGGDSVDSNGSITVNAGNVTLHGLANGGEMAFDFDGRGLVTGGNLLILGGSANISNTSTQNVVLQTLDGTIKTGETVKITDNTGKVIFETVAKRDTTSVTFSSSDVALNKTYTISSPSTTKTVTPTTLITNNQTGGMGMGGGQRGNKTQGTTGTNTTGTKTQTK